MSEPAISGPSVLVPLSSLMLESFLGQESWLVWHLCFSAVFTAHREVPMVGPLGKRWGVALNSWVGIRGLQ